jgi:hypothetical protein
MKKVIINFYIRNFHKDKLNQNNRKFIKNQ